jgi:phage tail sheath protein FI
VNYCVYLIFIKSIKDMPFFHGTEVDDVAALLIAIAQVNGSTIALVGTAPERPAGMTLVSTPNDAIQFGKSVFDGRTIPHALDAIIAQ